MLITDSFVQIRDVFQPASPAFIYNILNSSRKGSKLLSCKFVFCLFIESLSMRYVIRSIHHSTVCYFIALMSSLSCSRRVRSWFVLLRVPTVSHLRVKSKAIKELRKEFSSTWRTTIVSTTNLIFWRKGSRLQSCKFVKCFLLKDWECDTKFQVVSVCLFVSFFQCVCWCIFFFQAFTTNSKLIRAFSSIDWQPLKNKVKG